MTPLLLFLLGCAVIYLGTVSAAFSALMRLSLRLHAERSDRDDALGRYLDDPRRLFIPARMLMHHPDGRWRRRCWRASPASIARGLSAS